jgi:hypothetical protein
MACSGCAKRRTYQAVTSVNTQNPGPISPEQSARNAIANARSVDETGPDTESAAGNGDSK